MPRKDRIPTPKEAYKPLKEARERAEFGDLSPACEEGWSAANAAIKESIPERKQKFRMRLLEWLIDVVENGRGEVLIEFGKELKRRKPWEPKDPSLAAAFSLFLEIDEADRSKPRRVLTDAERKDAEVYFGFPHPFLIPTELPPQEPLTLPWGKPLLRWTGTELQDEMKRRGISISETEIRKLRNLWAGPAPRGAPKKSKRAPE